MINDLFAYGKAYINHIFSNGDIIIDPGYTLTIKTDDLVLYNNDGTNVFTIEDQNTSETPGGWKIQGQALNLEAFGGILNLHATDGLDLSVDSGAIKVNGNVFFDDGAVIFKELGEQGSVGYACLSGQGELFRSNIPCEQYNQ